ncbi:protein SPT2 homolog [Pararge aegeria]|uniref:Jg3869 protein n=5 Tax=Pararge aegeria TaxID=116150 RepID=A0A8S4S026_9NEOP|nr:protein SPT2 homolog [Pararge aegeria]CAH2244641.1 jg3869 [Pararge aegeria aegeria]
MEFRETLLAAQRNQQQKSSVGSSYYKARFDPPKKEQKSRDRLSANIQKFLAKKEEEEKQKKLDVQRKKDELLAMRDPKALRKIQKTLKVIKSANKSVIADAIDTEHTAVTREGPDQPDQDDYGYESQEAAALYEKMMQKYNKMPEVPKFSASSSHVNKDLNGTRERVKNALQHEEEPVPHKRRRRTENGDKDREASPPQKYEPEKKKDDKPEKPKFRKPAPPPMDFNQLLKLAEQKKSEPLEVAAKKVVSESESVRPMTKKQRREYEEEMARRQRRQERIDAEKSGKKVVKEERKIEKDKPEKRTEPSSFGRIPKLGEKNANNRKNEAPRSSEKDKHNSERDKADRVQSEKDRIRSEREKIENDKLSQEKERFERLKAERDRIDREMEKFKEREKLEKPKAKFEKTSDKKPDKIVDRAKIGARDHEIKKTIDLKSQNTYRIDKNSNEKKLNVPHKGDQRLTNGHVQGKPIPKMGREVVKDKLVAIKQKSSEGSPKPNGIRTDKKLTDATRPDDRRPMPSKPSAGSSKPPIINSFDFDKHIRSLGKNGRKFPPGGVKRKPHPDDIRKKQKRRLDSDSEYDSEMDDFIDDGDENMDYSTHIKEIFGYDKAKYRDLDDDDDPSMESSFSRQQREEYISKKIGIMEDLEDMRMEAMEKSKKKKQRRISDD